ncbi:MAG TPA: hypothetical protein VMG12_25595 [Polyangiaceae bacterium]|nr:hypothetical protein [Polyangiaceae bacterium]
MPGPQAAAITAARVSSQDNPYRPRLTLVERDGDPERGVALAVYVPGSASAALAVSMLVEARVRDAGLDAVAMHASASGFIMHALAASTEDVRRFVQVANLALTSPVTAADTERVAIHWRASPPRQASVASEAAVARCSGELVLGPDAEAAATIPTRLAGWLAGVRAGDAAFAVVGPREYLDAGADALARVAPWTRLGSTGGLLFGPELAGARALATGEQNLSVALWSLPPAAAIASAERLGSDDSLLSARLGAGFPPWRVWRVASNLSRGGACLRVDLQASGAPPSLDAVASSVANTVDELEYTLARVKPGPWVIAKQVMVMEGPDQAAAVAAWQAVTADPAVIESPPRRMVHYVGPLADSNGPERAARSLAVPPGAPPPSLELRRALEPGQGQFWMLLATPCGTNAEDGTSAGALALGLHAAALENDRQLDVSLEPWLSVDGVGLLAHAGPSAPHESAMAQAERVAEALARAVLRAGPSPEHIAASRESLLEALPSGPAPGLSLALRQTTGNHPSYLDARGTWASLTAISARSAQLERERFVRSKLRLAILGNHDDGQVQAAERRLSALLRSVDPGPVECPPRGAVVSVPGKYTIDAPGVRDADAVVAIPLPPSVGGPSEEASWTEWLMNRPGGWLHQALQRPGLVSTARARVLGGASAAALVIEIHAVDDKHEEAVAQVRGLLERLRAGAANAADVRSAREHLSQLTASRKLNPRGRLVDLWYGVRPPEATLDSLHALHRAAFEAGREVVVMTRPAQ